MRYCAICGRHHESETGCFGSELGEPPNQGMGEERSKSSPEQFKIIARQADRFIVRLLLFGLAGIALVMILVAVF